MDNLLLYLLKVSAGTTLLYFCYLLLFRKDTFYRRNRIFLILTLLLPIIFPTLKITVLSNAVIPALPAIAMENSIFSESTYETTISDTINSFDYNSLFIWIYFTITGLLLLRMVVSIVSTYGIIEKGTVKNNKFPKVIISGNQLPPFSFFPYVVIPAEDYESGNYNDILDHEFTHIRQGHTFDLLLSELLISSQWFNPFVWLIKRSIILNHEYLADHESLGNKSVKEYQYRLLNFKAGLKHISLAHNFNSLIKNRIIMINKKPTRKYATLKNILILPVVAIVAYAFATPEYNYVAQVNDALAIQQAPAIIQKEVKGIVLKEDGKPLENVYIACTGTVGNVMSAYSDSNGHFVLSLKQADSYLVLNYPGYKKQIIKADIKSEMIIRMEKDPDYKEPKYVTTSPGDGTSPQKPLVVLDGVITDQRISDLIQKLGPNFGTVINLMGKDATDKYGEDGKNGVVEVYSREKAKELGIKLPFQRNSPDDYPTFQGENYISFSEWVIKQIKYPVEASAKGIQGRISVTYSVEADGSVAKVTAQGKLDPLLSESVIKVVQSSPKWEPAKNQEAREPFSNMVSLKFELPDKVLPDDIFVVAETMPQYPGGDAELLNFIKNNIKYPDAAKAEKIEGRVAIKFIINIDGNAEDPVVLKGVNPILDSEALRVVGLLKGFQPGTKSGKAVGVYYVVPITFSLPKTNIPK
jgi:TonB family protein